ncbi:S8/S53 family peptidase [uncultured Kordia sp.]|uniref:S8 family peptidase n=1 Tax=uncultured Kordia sp. TaxID=507699 RepID=UPI0026178C91|nr:S8/S53 family peptidase [uncultured Kordia sp.]
MRNIQKLIAIFLLISVTSCTKDDTFIDTTKDENLNIKAKNGGGINSQTFIPGNLPVYSQNEFVIQFKDGTPDSMKFTIRESNGIDGDNINPQQGFGSFEICKCDNPDFEKWIFPPGTISIEPKKQVIEGQIGGEIFGIADIDYEFEFGFDVESPILGTAADTNYESYIKPSNNGITVALLDTGLAPALTVFSESTFEPQFLYNATVDEFAESEAQSGWDFVDNDPNTFDDDPFKHGSIIGDLIHNALANLEIKHQILPLKIADSNGNISYFATICSLVYASERSDIINASFGWHGDPFGDFGNTIFENVLEMFPDVILVASAGNTSHNNDTTPHYPSSFNKPNVIAVGSCNQGYGRASDFSNYGTSVDFFTKGEGISFYGSFVSGTSFAAPQITIEVAKILNSGELSELTMTQRVASLGIPVTLEFMTVTDLYTGEEVVKNTLHNRYILAED